jgi:tetratricopeptide (TPR) repeat protein
MSKNHVPRWFTEGLSEYETIVRRPEWHRTLDPELYSALSRNLLPGAVDMNKAFTHESELDVTTAYYAASQMIIYTADTYGFAKIVQALKLWGQGVRTVDVIPRAFGVSPADYDAGYKAWEMARLVRYRTQYEFDLRPKDVDEAQADVKASPQSARAHVVLALSLARAEKLEEAQKELAAALKLDPNDKNAHYLAYKLASSNDDAAGASAHLAAIRKAGGDGYTIEMAFAELAEGSKKRKGDTAAMRAALEAAHKWDPTQSEPLGMLYKLDKAEHKDGEALDALRAMAPLEPHDPQIWRALLGKLVAAKAWDEAKRVGEGAMFVDVETASTHVAYARALSATGDHAKAIFELGSALLCENKPPDEATAHALLAREYLATGDKARAKQELDQALQLDPQNAEAKGIKVP